MMDSAPDYTADAPLPLASTIAPKLTKTYSRDMRPGFRTGGNIGPLPVELLDIIFEEICNDEETIEGWRRGGPTNSSSRKSYLIELTEVCCGWRHLAQRALFRDVVYSFSRPLRSDEPPWDGRLDGRWIITGCKTPRKTLKEFATFLAQNVRLAQAIRNLRLRCHIVPTNPAYQRIQFDLEDSDKVDPHSFFNLIQLLPQLRQLHLWDVILTQPLDPLPIDNLISLNGVYICHSVAHASAEDVCKLLPCFGEVDELSIVRLGSWSLAPNVGHNNEEEADDDEEADNEGEVDDAEAAELEEDDESDDPDYEEGHTDEESDDSESEDERESLDGSAGGVDLLQGEADHGPHEEYQEAENDTDADDVEALLDANGLDSSEREEDLETEEDSESAQETETDVETEEDVEDSDVDSASGGESPAESDDYDSIEGLDLSEKRDGATWWDVWYLEDNSEIVNSQESTLERLAGVSTEIYTYGLERTPSPPPTLPELLTPEITAPGLKIKSLGLSEVYVSPEAILRQIIHSPSRETITRLVFCEIPPPIFAMLHLQAFTNALSDHITEIRWLLMTSDMLHKCLYPPPGMEPRYSMAALTKLQRLTFGLSFPLGEPVVVCSMNSFLYDIIRNSSISPDTHPDFKEITIEISSDESEVPSLPVCRSDWWLDSPREEGMNDCLQDILLQTVKYFKLPHIVFECIDIIYHDNEKAVVTASQLESLAARMFNRLRSLGCIEFRPARGNYLLPLGIWQSVDVSRDAFRELA